MKRQTAAVLDLLRFFGDMGLTQQDAIREIACYRLAARIEELRKDGIEVRSALASDGRGHRYSRYWLVEAPVQLGFVL